MAAVFANDDSTASELLVLPTRRPPRTPRSSARLQSLIDAAAVVLARDGREALTTSSVAKESASSIGTVYTYFPDREAVLRAVAHRNRQHVHDAVLALAAPTPERFMDVLVDAYRKDAALRSLGLGLGTIEDGAAEQLLWLRCAELLIGQVPASHRLATWCQLAHASVASAFRYVAHGDEFCLDVARTLLLSFPEVSSWGEPSRRR